MLSFDINWKIYEIPELNNFIGFLVHRMDDNLRESDWTLRT